MDMLNRESLRELIRLARGDADLIDMLQRCFSSMEAYHSAIFEMETRMELFDSSGADYQDMASEQDKRRSICHDSLISNIRMLNRLATAQSLPPVYNGTVSEKQPYRRQLADAVLAYVEAVVRERC